MSSPIIAPPIPAGVKQDQTFSVQVRPAQGGEWIPVSAYAARVDMHDVRQAAVGIFDFTGRVEVIVRPQVSWIHSAVIRPLSLGIEVNE